MTAIVWDQIGDRVYESGVDRGVLYFPDGGGVPWNGLTAVDSSIKKTVEAVYYDGVKVNDIVNVGDFQGTLKAYTFPDEFLEFEGVQEDRDGMFVTGQNPKMFHLAYRTIIGNDIEGDALGYKLHLLWNLIAIPSTRGYESLSSDPSAIHFEWSLTSIPDYLDDFAPSSYLIIDSRTIDSELLSDLETILYGTVGVDPTIPSISEVLVLGIP